jgi:F-type H+-transporting ATPase subunit b
LRSFSGLGSAGLMLLSSTAHAAEAKEGMPQLNFANPLTFSQVVWMAIIFAVLYLLLSRWALPEVAGVLEARSAAIGSDLEAARNAKIEADAAVSEFTDATRQAQNAAHAEIANAVAKAKEQAAARAATLNARLEKQLADAEQQIASARTAAFGAVRQVATDTAATVISRLTGTPADRQSVDHAVAAALTARGHA